MEVKGKACAGTKKDSLSEFPRFNAAQTLTKGRFAAAPPSHTLVCGDSDKEDAASDDGLVDEAAGGLPLTGGVERRGYGGDRHACSPWRMVCSGWWP